MLLVRSRVTLLDKKKNNSEALRDKNILLSDTQPKNILPKQQKKQFWFQTK